MKYRENQQCTIMLSANLIDPALDRRSGGSELAEDVNNKRIDRIVEDGLRIVGMLGEERADLISLLHRLVGMRSAETLAFKASIGSSTGASNFKASIGDTSQ